MVLFWLFMFSPLLNPVLRQYAFFSFGDMASLIYEGFDENQVAEKNIFGLYSISG